LNARRCGLILLNKPEGVTSFRALAPVKQAVGHSKIGHTGTLDKFACGVLPLLAGSYTKLTPFFSTLDKTYTGTVRFGEETSTLDPEGEVIGQGPVPDHSSVEHALEAFRGNIQQVPPAFSALHVDGKRAYKRALDGEQVDLPPRPVTIYSLELIAWNPPDLTISVRCSKGTYIRSLARDLGRACGSAAHLLQLRRDAVGRFTVQESVGPQDFDPERDLRDSADLVARLPEVGHIYISEKAVPLISRGVPPKDDWFPGSPFLDGNYAVSDAEGRLMALVRLEEGSWSYHFVIGRETQ
jgi:tRNA pseudouridine55 synthase